ncbi:hypothetical protein OIV83_003617 [Microbotryomycetes sp. JL201]|nr:hypothetical protein OIV83_003617 [Microbotryomycetes sp. JL201]
MPTSYPASRQARSTTGRTARRPGPRESTTRDEIIRQQSAGRRVSSVFAQDATPWLGNDNDEDDEAVSLRKSAGSSSQRRISDISATASKTIPFRSRNASATSAKTTTTTTTTTVAASRSSTTPARVTKPSMPPPPPSTMKQQREEEARLRKLLEDKLDEMRAALELSNNELERMQEERSRWDEDRRRIEGEWHAERDRMEAETGLLETEVKGLGRRLQEENARWIEERKHLQDEVTRARAVAARTDVESRADVHDVERLRLAVSGHEILSLLGLAACRHEAVGTAARAELDATADFVEQLAHSRRELQAWKEAIAVQS